VKRTLLETSASIFGIETALVLKYTGKSPWPTSSARIKTMLGFLVTTGLSADLEGMSKRDKEMKKRALLSRDIDPSDGFIFTKDEACKVFPTYC